MDAVGVRSEIIRDSKDGLLQCRKEFTRRRRVNLIDVYLFLIQLVPAAINAIKALLEHRRRGSPHCFKTRLIQFGCVHLPRAAKQVVSLVHQHADTPLIGDGQSRQCCVQIKVTIVVADDYITPADQLLGKIVGANLMLASDSAQRIFIQRARVPCITHRCSGDFQCGGSCLWKPVIESPARGQDSPWQAFSGCSHALSRAINSSTLRGSVGSLFL